MGQRDKTQVPKRSYLDKGPTKAQLERRNLVKGKLFGDDDDDPFGEPTLPLKDHGEEGSHKSSNERKTLKERLSRSMSPKRFGERVRGRSLRKNRQKVMPHDSKESQPQSTSPVRRPPSRHQSMGSVAVRIPSRHHSTGEAVPKKKIPSRHHSSGEVPKKKLSRSQSTGPAASRAESPVRLPSRHQSSGRTTPRNQSPSRNSPSVTSPRLLSPGRLSSALFSPGILQRTRISLGGSFSAADDKSTELNFDDMRDSLKKDKVRLDRIQAQEAVLDVDLRDSAEETILDRATRRVAQRRGRLTKSNTDGQVLSHMRRSIKSPQKRLSEQEPDDDDDKGGVSGMLHRGLRALEMVYDDLNT